MIVGVFGLPGSGKSTFLTSAAVHWQKGKSFMGIKPAKVIFSNFYCEGCYKLDFDKLGLYNFCDCNILIDEIMLLADTRNFKTFPESLKQFFALHRKSLGDGHGVLWASQYYDDCDKKIRVLTHKYYLLEKGKILPFFSFAKPILREMKPKHGAMSDQFILGAPVTWVPVFRPRYYHAFDSYESKLHELPPVELVPWDDPIADDPIADDPAADDPIADDPAADDPAADDPAALLFLKRIYEFMFNKKKPS